MNPREAYLLSPYRPPTSYPVSLTPEEAESWLTGYFSLWHPAVLMGLTAPPKWSSPYDHDNPIEGFVYAVQSGPTVYQPEDWHERVRNLHGIAIKATQDRAATTALLLDALRAAGRNDPQLEAPPEAVRLFASLGFGYMVVESLFDAMEHTHLLDEPAFWSEVREAAEMLTSADVMPEVRAKLKSAGEKLAYARQTLNSNSIRLFDFAMLNRGHLAAAWPKSLQIGLPLNVIAPGEVLQALNDTQPERFAELKAKFHTGLASSVDLCCGAFREREDSLFFAESQWWNLRAARDTVARLFEVQPTIYARTRTALHPQLPSWLQHMGFKNAVVIPFDGALAPTRNSAIVSWPAPDGKSVDAFGREPQDASDPQTFFNLVYHIHQAMTQDSTPAVALKHTGQPAAVGYEELLGMSELGDIVGEWMGLSRFFGENHYGDYLGYSTADDYFADYLDDRVTNRHSPEPVSGFAKLARLRRKLDCAYTIAALHRSLSAPGEEENALMANLEQVEREVEVAGADEIQPSPGSLREPPSPTRGEGKDVGFDTTSLPSPLVGEGLGVRANSSLDSLQTAWAKKLAERIQVRAAENQPGYMVFNPCNFTRRVALEIEGMPGPVPVVEPVKASEFNNGTARVVVEVPSLGFAWFPKPAAGGMTPKPRIKTAEGTAVRNEFLEADFDPATGVLRGFRDMRNRINRFGMQLVFNPGSKTRARKVTVTNSGTALGEVVCEGDILDDHDTLLATFTQRLRMWISRPALELRIEIDPQHKPTGYPWHAYYGARFLWRDDRAALFRGVNGANVQTTYTRPVSPDYLEVRLGSERTFIFTGGLPFIQKQGGRSADVILIPEGEQAKTFDLLLACDRDYPMQTAAGWIAPSPVIATTKGAPHIGPSGWLGHVDLPSLLLTSLRPVVAGEGANRAIAARFIETAGFGGAAEVRFARDPAKAFTSDGMESRNSEIALNNGGIPVDFSAGEAFRIIAEW